MRTIPLVDFWNNVERHLGKDEYEDRCRKSWGEVTCTTAQEFEDLARRESAPFMLVAFEANGCRNVESQKSYLEETLKVAVDCARVEPRLLGDVSIPEVREEVSKLKEEYILPKYRAIEARFVAEHRCCFKDGIYLCYCDETTA